MSTTISDLRKLCYEATVYCRNPRCARVRLDGTAPNGIPLDLSRLDPAWTKERLERALVCSECGSPGKVRWVQVASPGTYWRLTKLPGEA